MKINKRTFLNQFFETSIICLGYMGSAWIGFYLAEINPRQDSTVWPPEGIALGALLLLHRRAAWGIFLGAFLANYLFISHLLLAIVLALGNCAGIFLNYWILHKLLKIKYPLESPRSVVLFLTVGTNPGAILAAFVGALSLKSLASIENQNFFELFLNWYLSKELGFVIFSACIVAFAKTYKNYNWGFKSTTFAIVNLIIMILVSNVVFTMTEPIFYLPIPFLIFASVRFRDIGATISIFVLSLISAYHTARGKGPFAGFIGAGKSLDITLVYLDTYIVSMTVLSYMLIAVLKEREKAQRKVIDKMKMIEMIKDESTHELERKVIERTRIIELQSLEIEKQLVMSQKIQMALLPQYIPEVDGVSIAYNYLPMMKLGGDFLDIKYFERKKTLGFFMCDVSGHGIPAAFLAALVKMSLQGWYEDPKDVVGAANDLYISLKDKLGNNFITASFLYLDQRKKELRFARAGHLPLEIIDKNGIVKSYSPKGKVIMNMAPPACEELKIQLQDGDTILLYTDGIIEARCEKNPELFSSESFMELIQKNYTQSVSELCETIVSTIIEYSGDKDHLEDDVSVMLIRLEDKSDKNK